MIEPAGIYALFIIIAELVYIITHVVRAGAGAQIVLLPGSIIICMLFEMTMVLLGVAVGGFGLAAYWDLKTTEFPDWLPYVMIGLALAVRGVFSFLMQDFSYIINGIMIGCLFLGFGLLLYYLKQWGDGDAWLLGVLGFLFPDSGSFATAAFLPFPAVLLFNFFLISFFYLLVYSVVLGMKSSGAFSGFMKELKEGGRDLARVIVVFTVACVLLMGYMTWQFGIPVWNLLYVLVFPVLLFSVLVFTRYGRFVEENLFKRKVPASRLRVGDVLVEDKWRGLTEKEVRRLKKKGGDVWIKEGVRFAPVFVITVLVTLFLGNLLMVFI